MTDAPNLVGLLPETYPSQAELQDRGLGALLGLAVGNLLGLPVEGWSRDAIARHYPEGVVDIDPMERNRAMDDDLAQAVELGEALLDGGDYIGGLAQRLVRWRRENGRGIGHTTWQVIDLLEGGYAPPEAGRMVYHRLDGIAPNGGLMRCVPVALARYSNPALLVGDSAATCTVTHYAPLCQWSCIIANVTVAMLLRGAQPLALDLADAAVADGTPTEVRDWLVEIGDDIGDLQLDSGLIGHTLLCLQSGIWALGTPLGFQDALVTVVSAGGDTDTNGAVAGAILGARYGIQSIPKRWLDCVPQRERLENLAGGLLVLPD